MPSGLKKLKLPLPTLGGVPPPKPPCCPGGAEGLPEPPPGGQGPPDPPCAQARIASTMRDHEVMMARDLINSRYVNFGTILHECHFYDICNGVIIIGVIATITSVLPM